MVKNILWIVTVFFVCACSTVKDKSNQEPVVSLLEKGEENDFEMQKRGIDFSASGSGSDWVLEIDFDKKVKFSSPDLEKDFEVNVLRLGEGLKGSEATHELVNSEGKLSVRIQNKDTQLVQRDEKPFDVLVTYNDQNNQNNQSFHGEGAFYGDIRLHDSWLLEKINGVKLDTAKVERQPYMDIYLDQGKAMGFMGCNSFSSDIHFGRNEIYFHLVLSTKMACMHDAIEPLFSKAISGKVLTYKVDDLQLVLENETDTLLFKKRE